MKVLILADLPIWLLPGGENYGHSGAYSSWLEALFPYFGLHEELEVEWLIFSKSVKKATIIEMYGQRVHVLPRWKKMVSMLTVYLLESSLVKKVVHNVQPDIVHAWGSEDVFGIAGARLKYPKVFSLQGSLTDYLKKIGGGFLMRLQASLERRTICAYNHASAESELARSLILEHHPSCSVDLVDYGVHPSFFEVEWSPSKSPIVVFVGTIDKRKGTSDLIDAFSDSSLSHVTLVMVGAGALVDELKERASSNVEWRGKLSRDEIQVELAQSWGLLMPTYADTGPTVLKEARVVGLPVVTTHTAGAKDYLIDGQNGAIIEPGDVQAIIDSALLITESRDKCQAMGGFGWKSTREELHPTRSIQKFAELYTKVLSLQ